MMAKMKVHGISDKVMGLSSPRTMFFISLEPVEALSAKFSRKNFDWLLRDENIVLGDESLMTLSEMP